ncbi:uncharacterized protein N7500_000688 [Penicillium coprophilum]|uniref:uncharacterized protein n=1 Tax=Penicillium coprophilum TaxID=36646 RepID=UPI0023842E64|nr:uncharacterized protein N7500_000688 [Penicillium coprophilum]KAJ5177989.1 hypothetical protein N7500_000688 [Penicillium coprophilum]
MPSPRPSKRQRICRACDQCRRRKSKCDGGQPTCSICHTANRTCSYQNGGGRRGLAPGYVRSLETVLGLVLQHVPNSERTVHDLLTKSRNNDHFLSRDPATIWRQSRLVKYLSRLIENDSQEHLTTAAYDESEWDTLETINTTGVVTAGTEPATSGVNEPSMPQEIRNAGTNQPDCLFLPFPPDTLSMLENYFTYTHCWFPILERRDLFRTMHTSLGPEASPSHVSSLVLWAVVAYESSTKNGTDSKQPDPLRIQQSICGRVMTHSPNLELGHIQAVIILALLQLRLGDIKNSWRLAGQASRMLVTLPMTSKNNRYRNTFHGCILLDNILSAVLNKAPCMSLEEQQKEGPINEDTIEEWDVWSVPQRASEGGYQNTPKGPLRALSIFNSLRQIMMYLARILYMSTNLLRADERELSATLQAVEALQKVSVEKYPHTRGSEYNNPSLLTLHLTCLFVKLDSLKRSPTHDMTEKALLVNLVQSSINLLDRYLELTGAVHLSPLLCCFALQCQQCFSIVHPDIDSDERRAFENRLRLYLQNLEAGMGTLQRFVNVQSTRVENVRIDAFSNGVVHPPDLQMLETHPENSIIAPANPAVDTCAISTLQSPAGITFAETEGFDALFEEMVTSIPMNRQQPLFAQNLGFYAGDLDQDFLEQLQQPADG